MKRKSNFEDELFKAEDDMLEAQRERDMNEKRRR